jgi:hypothetical protein
VAAGAEALEKTKAQADLVAQVAEDLGEMDKQELLAEQTKEQVEDRQQVQTQVNIQVVMVDQVLWLLKFLLALMQLLVQV